MPSHPSGFAAGRQATFHRRVERGADPGGGAAARVEQRLPLGNTWHSRGHLFGDRRYDRRGFHVAVIRPGLLVRERTRARPAWRAACGCWPGRPPGRCAGGCVSRSAPMLWLSMASRSSLSDSPSVYGLAKTALGGGVTDPEVGTTNSMTRRTSRSVVRAVDRLQQRVDRTVSQQAPVCHPGRLRDVLRVSGHVRVPALHALRLELADAFPDGDERRLERRRERGAGAGRERQRADGCRTRPADRW